MFPVIICRRGRVRPRIRVNTVAVIDRERHVIDYPFFGDGLRETFTEGKWSIPTIVILFLRYLLRDTCVPVLHGLLPQFPTNTKVPN